MARQGPHHVAQKSTSTGLSDFNTSWSKFASVTSTIPLPAIFSPRCKRRSVGGRSIECRAVPAIYKCFPVGSRTIYRNTAIGCRGTRESRKRLHPSQLRCRQAGRPQRAEGFASPPLGLGVAESD